MNTTSLNLRNKTRSYKNIKQLKCIITFVFIYWTLPLSSNKI